MRLHGRMRNKITSRPGDAGRARRRYASACPRQTRDIMRCPTILRYTSVQLLSTKPSVSLPVDI